jgi:Common central domain of tyrosinase/Polyphenol oxidase middle domain
MKVRVAVLLLCVFCGGIAQAQAGGIRRSIFALDPNGPEVASLRHGIQAMKRRSDSNPSDPTGWVYQANMHSTLDSPARTAWNTCQHGSFFFFSWHRMYLYYFERILRAASGDPNLALPYWNYTDDPNVADPGQRQLPLAFRQPAVECGSPPTSWDTTPNCNPLFVSNRGPGINAGTTFLQPGAVDYSRAFTCTNFEAPGGTMCSSSFGFGGGGISQPAHFDGAYGALELTPHNAVHVGVGGWMGDPDFAARDPIFFLHHANVDRLWSHWLARGGGRQDPTTDQVWMNTTFTFFDENGQQVQLSGKDILNTASQLSYCYDDEPGCCPQCCRQSCDNAESTCFDACPDPDCSDLPTPQARRACIRAAMVCIRGCRTERRQCVAGCK